VNGVRLNKAQGKGMDLKLPQDFDEQDALNVVDQARPMLSLPPDAKIQVEDVKQSARGTRIVFSYTASVELRQETPDAVTGVYVSISAHGDLRFDSKGALVTAEVEPADPNQLRAISDNLAKLVASDQVYIAKPGEKIDPDKLRAQGKAWYVEQDADGKKYLKRAWIS
jgi:hypothetical protein